MKALPIIWYRLVKAGETCSRCDGTYQELEKAVSKLKTALAPLGIDMTLEARELTEAEFKLHPEKSNQVWINGRLAEKWLGAEMGMTPCSTVCEGSICRTIEIDGKSYETIPEELFLKAGLIAASQMTTSEMSDQSSQSCCDKPCS